MVIDNVDPYLLPPLASNLHRCPQSPVSIWREHSFVNGRKKRETCILPQRSTGLCREKVQGRSWKNYSRVILWISENKGFHTPKWSSRAQSRALLALSSVRNLVLVWHPKDYKLWKQLEIVLRIDITLMTGIIVKHVSDRNQGSQRKRKKRVCSVVIATDSLVYKHFFRIPRSNRRTLWGRHWSTLTTNVGSI